MNKAASLEKITAWAKRRGFVYPSSEIYGGLANTYDFGPYGTQLKNNVRDSWWNFFVKKNDNILGIDTSIILNPQVWHASGHVERFADAMIDCKNCKNRTRADKLIEEALDDVKVEGRELEELDKIIVDNDLKCPVCGKRDWTKARKFSTLFETSVGIIVDDKSKVYLRGEIAQGLFLSYKNILDSMRVKLPFGIAQQGKAFRNEITKGQFTYRTLEFDLMEFEYFIRQQDWKEAYNHWKDEAMTWFESLGISKENLRWREHTKDELSHYSDKTEDVEYNFSFGWNEVGAVAYRTDFDLKNHMEHTETDLTYRDQETGEKFIPHVIEPTFGHSRIMTMLFNEAYTEEELENGKTRVVLKFDPKIAPVKIAIFPLQKDEKLKDLAREIYKNLSKDYVCEFDDAGNIGKMYRRQDEIGTPFCITVDFDTLEDKSVTIRHRDTMEQERIKIEELEDYFEDKF